MVEETNYASMTNGKKRTNSLIVNDICPSEVQDLFQYLACTPPEKDGYVITVLDVRSPHEYSASHLEGSINFDLKSPFFRQQILGFDRKKIYLVYCRTGVRSRLAAKIMGDMGFEKLYNLTGGINRWQREGFLVVKPKDKGPG